MRTEDELGRLSRTETYNGTALYAWTDYSYDKAGRLWKTTQNSNPNTTVETLYDSLDRKVQVNDPDSGTWTYAYDRSGNLITQNDPALGRSVQLCYDGLNRVTKKFYRTSDTPSPPTPAQCASSCSLGGSSICYSFDETGHGPQSACTIGRPSPATRFRCRGRRGVFATPSALWGGMHAAVAFSSQRPPRPIDRKPRVNDGEDTSSRV